MEIVIVSLVLLVGVIYGYRSLSGSGIAKHPHGKIYSGAPGAKDPGSGSGRDERLFVRNWSRGAR
jgi:hypothetical protein